jgi:hypothetical protein
MDEHDIQRTLDAFEQDPKAAMNRLPDKRDAATKDGTPAPNPFAPADIAEGTYVLHRDTVRGKFAKMVDGVIVTFEDVIPGRAGIEAKDHAEDLVDTLKYQKPSEMDAAKLTTASLEVSPWSDDYWAVYLGGLGKRYADPDFPAAEDWKKNFDYISAHPVAAIAASGDEKAIDLLSPSEKYDLLVGDTSRGLTSSMWSQGKYYYDEKGSVETWMGICHGWAPASYMLPRPSRAVTAIAADGKTKLRFYPSDIKALASLLWANARTVSKFIGTRSSDKEPKTDEVGRVLSSQVFDTNPGTWHLAVVNQIGVSKRSFVIDATYDYEVWNQPFYAYEYRYFNPQAMTYASDLGAATVARGDFAKDRFAKYRGPNGVAFAGVAMRVNYVVETEPSHNEVDTPKNDAMKSVDYYYDLELDASEKIVGGEWYMNRHPDFLWTPPKRARAVTPADALAKGRWDLAAKLPSAWRRAAVQSSASGLPLAKIVEQLIKAANR